MALSPKQRMLVAEAFAFNQGRGGQQPDQRRTVTVLFELLMKPKEEQEATMLRWLEDYAVEHNDKLAGLDVAHADTKKAMEQKTADIVELQAAIVPAERRKG